MSQTKLSLRGKLLSIAITGVAACTIVGAVAGAKLNALGRAETAVAEDATPSLLVVAKINDAVNDVREAELQLSLSTAPEQIAEHEKELYGDIAVLAPLFVNYEQRIDNDVERRLYNAVRGNFEIFKSRAIELVAEIKSGDEKRVAVARSAARNESGREFDAVGKDIDALSAFNERAVKDTHEEATATLTRAMVLLICVTLAAAAVLFVLTTLVMRAILRQIGGEPSTSPHSPTRSLEPT